MPSPLKEPEKVNFVVFRENTEDVYSGIEWEQGSPEVKKVIAYLHDEFGIDVRADSGLGVKPISVHGSKRLVRKAVQYALRRNRRSVTLVHKGNIMKFTEGAFMQWGYDLAAEEFPNDTITEDAVWEQHGGEPPSGKVVMKDRIADIMFQHALTRPEEFDVLATPNLNGDYLSDACAAMVGGVGIAAGANIGDEIGLFEATHGSAPKHAGKDKANPTALLLSGVMMLEHMGWDEAAQSVQDAIDATISQKRVTYDLERQMDGAEKLAASEYADAIVENLS
jgi:isocitrate dehydrogenase